MGHMLLSAMLSKLSATLLLSLGRNPDDFAIFRIQAHADAWMFQKLQNGKVSLNLNQGRMAPNITENLTISSICSKVRPAVSTKKK